MTENSTEKKSYFEWLLSPWAIFAGIFLGSLIGLKSPSIAILIEPLGNIYLSLLQMCILPILITAIISSLGHMIQKNQAGKYLKKLLIFFIGGMLLASCIGTFSAILIKPGAKLSEESRAILGKMIAQSEVNSSSENICKSPSIIDFFQQMIPENIFYSFTRGENLPILFFCILLGISLGFVRSNTGETALHVTEALYDAFQNLIGWVMYGLPFGLMCLFASQVMNAGLEAFKALGLFVVLCYAGAISLILIYHLIITARLKRGFFFPLKHLKETMVIALGTSSSFAAIPPALKTLQKNFKISRDTSNLVVPLGVNLNPQGSILHFAISTIFMAQLYDVALSPQAILIVILGSVMAGMAATGVPGAGALSMISLVLLPLGLPSQAAVILLLAVDPLIDPILTAVTMHANCSAAIMIHENPNNLNQDEIGG